MPKRPISKFYNTDAKFGIGIPNRRIRNTDTEFGIGIPNRRIRYTDTEFGIGIPNRRIRYTDTDTGDSAVGNTDTVPNSKRPYRTITNMHVNIS